MKTINQYFTRRKLFILGCTEVFQILDNSLITKCVWIKRSSNLEILFFSLLHLEKPKYVFVYCSCKKEDILIVCVM